ncbi:sec-independent protein translocase protein TatC [Cerasibacillus quisquiliarum]|uniref:Sec-independent protein translocase protein TatC n=1 Tax=Cerasibacillus quisquiliarum TaxID=227865 RepID=A0A511UXS1_9BACI|nr:twin-arginine translocase subunit TatC [Cerasibacillus quisquiliarum]MBB5145988.1 sec-independent protein translocase protein TatC [Cerasibacillus quisquiliarum]GEN30558.1 Sec-independent protein translocase protein TatC [Cerasibacillus quisquiliarum]
MSEDLNSNEAKEMNVTEHLSELRNRLIVTAIMFIVLFIVAFIYHKPIYHFFEKDIPFKLAVTSLGEIIWIYFTLAGVVALAGTIPFLSLQLWLFIKPGLTKRERRASLMYIPVIFLLFLGGIIFGYFMFIKLILPFLLSLNDGMFNEIFTVGNYFRFVFKVSLPFALFFEVPIIAMFLTQLGILTPSFMKKIRKYAYFIMVIIGAAVTPPDFFLQIVVAVPLIILYEISIYLSHFVYRKKIAKHEAFMEDTN